MTSATTSPVIASREGGLETLTLNRPARLNVLSDDMLACLQQHLERLAADEGLRCLVLAAAGKAFCAGHDLGEMHGTHDELRLRDLFARCSRVMQALQSLPVPVIAQVQGVAAAAGCQLVAACDLAVAARGARFAVSGINLGLFCSTPAVALSRNVPAKAAFDMLFTGRFVDAEEAKAIGLVNVVVAEDELDAAVRDYAITICGKDPEAVRLGKRLFYAQRDMPLADAYRLAGDTMARNMNLAGARTGIAAFLAKGSAERG